MRPSSEVTVSNAHVVPADIARSEEEQKVPAAGSPRMLLADGGGEMQMMKQRSKISTFSLPPLAAGLLGSNFPPKSAVTFVSWVMVNSHGFVVAPAQGP